MRDRLISQFEYKFSDGGAEEGVFEDYASTFGSVDYGGDMVLKGAYLETLRDWKKRKSMPKMLFQHGRSFGFTGPLPVGKWLDMYEDEKGLYAKGRLINLDTENGKTLYGAMKEGELDRLSIGYVAKDFSYGTKPDEPYRTLKQVDLREVSLVTFPMNDEAGLTSVKSISEFTIREFEQALVSGMLPPMTETEAKALLAKGFCALAPERDANGQGDAELKELILHNINLLTMKG